MPKAPSCMLTDVCWQKFLNGVKGLLPLLSDPNLKYSVSLTVSKKIYFAHETFHGILHLFNKVQGIEMQLIMHKIVMRVYVISSKIAFRICVT